MKIDHYEKRGRISSWLTDGEGDSYRVWYHVGGVHYVDTVVVRDGVRDLEERLLRALREQGTYRGLAPTG